MDRKYRQMPGGVDLRHFRYLERTLYDEQTTTLLQLYYYLHYHNI